MATVASYPFIIGMLQSINISPYEYFSFLNASFTKSTAYYPFIALSIRYSMLLNPVYLITISSPSKLYGSSSTIMILRFTFIYELSYLFFKISGLKLPLFIVLYYLIKLFELGILLIVFYLLKILC